MLFIFYFMNCLDLVLCEIRFLNIKSFFCLRKSCWLLISTISLFYLEIHTFDELYHVSFFIMMLHSYWLFLLFLWDVWLLVNLIFWWFSLRRCSLLNEVVLPFFNFISKSDFIYLVWWIGRSMIFFRHFFLSLHNIVMLFHSNSFVIDYDYINNGAIILYL